MGIYPTKHFVRVKYVMVKYNINIIVYFINYYKNLISSLEALLTYSWSIESNFETHHVLIVEINSKARVHKTITR